MNTDLSAEPNPVSEARLKANRANAKLSTGPTPSGQTRTRFNALKHGLSARMVLPGQDRHQNQEFLGRAWACLGPRNPVEEICVANLLETRLREHHFLEVERTVLTRKPVSPTSNVEQRYAFLDDPTALKTLEQMARHEAHLTRAADKDLLALLRVRQENWSGPSQSASKADFDAEGAVAAECRPDTDPPPASGGIFEGCLADKRLILPGENEEDYEAFSHELWATFQPANLLEGFIISDFIQAQWRLERVLRIERSLFERCAISASGDNCGFGFAFVQDAQRNQALESLRQYEAVLRKRLEKRMTLWRKLRKEGWVDAILPNPQPPAVPQPPTPPTSASSSGHLAATSRQASGQTPNLEPTPVLVTPSLDPAGDPLGQQANTGTLTQCRAAGPPNNS